MPYVSYMKHFLPWAIFIVLFNWCLFLFVKQNWKEQQWCVVIPYVASRILIFWMLLRFLCIFHCHFDSCILGIVCVCVYFARRLYATCWFRKEYVSCCCWSDFCWIVCEYVKIPNNRHSIEKESIHGLAFIDCIQKATTKKLVANQSSVVWHIVLQYKIRASHFHMWVGEIFHISNGNQLIKFEMSFIAMYKM